MLVRPLGICGRSVVALLGAASVFHEDSQVVSAAVEHGSLRVPTVVNTLGQAAVVKAVSEFSSGRLLAGVAHPEKRRGLSGLHTSTKCIEGQSFSVISSRSPDLDGCYTESGLGRVPRLVGEYAYLLSRDTTDGMGENSTAANITAGVVAISVPGVDEFHWALASTLKPARPEEHSTTCLSLLPADHLHHPADGPWVCEFAGNGTDVVTPTATEFSVSCGCSGSRSSFDRQASLQRAKGYPAGGSHTSTSTTYHPRYSASRSTDGRMSWILATLFVGLVVRLERMRQINNITRLQRLLRERAGEAGVEQPERAGEALPLQTPAQRQTIESDQ